MWESRVLRRAFERLELHEWKHSRAVLRGGGGGDVTSLPDTWVGNHPSLPGPDYVRSHRAPGGVGGCRLCQPSLFQQGVVGAFAQGFGLLTSDFGVGTSQDLGFLPFLTWLDQVPESACRGHKSFIPKRLDCVP